MASSAPMRPGARPSVIAMTLCLLIVAGSVLFGVFGPSIAQRSMPGGGVSIGDLLGNAVVLRDQLLWQALEAESRTPTGTRLSPTDDRGDLERRGRSMESAADSALTRVLGRTVPIPDLSAEGYALAAWSVVSLRGGRDDTVVLGYLDRARTSFVALFLTTDDGHFVVFDSFGRAVPLMPDRLFSEEVPRSPRADGVAMVWSTGPVLAIAVIDSSEQASSLRAALGAP